MEEACGVAYESDRARQMRPLTHHADQQNVVGVGANGHGPALPVDLLQSEPAPAPLPDGKIQQA